MPRRPLKSDTVIFFDIGNVLLKFDVLKAAAKVARALGRNPLTMLRYFGSSSIVDEVERGKISPRQLWRLFREKLGYAGSFRQFERLWCGHFKLNRRSASLLKSLARRHRVYLLSNTNHLHYEHIRRRYAFPRHAHGAVLSYKVGLRKPEPAIYRAALKLAKVKPSQAVFIDDLKENVAAARKLGIRAILHSRGTDLRKELSLLGVR